MPRFNATRTRQRNAGAIAKALARQRDQFRDDYEALVVRHRQEIRRLRAALDDTLQINGVLSDHLDSLESENIDLRVRLSELRTFAQIAKWRRNRIVSWRGWFRTATDD